MGVAKRMLCLTEGFFCDNTFVPDTIPEHTSIGSGISARLHCCFLMSCKENLQTSQIHLPSVLLIERTAGTS